MKYTSIDRVFAKLRRDRGNLQGIGESDIIEWVGEALEFMGAVSQYEEAVSFIEIKNHQAYLPYGYIEIIQVANNHCWEDKCNICVTNVLDEEEEVLEEIGVPIDCEGKPITQYDMAYYRPFIDFRYKGEAFNSSRLYNTCFTPIRPATNTIHDNCVNCRDEYRIIRGEVIRTSFKEGQIAVSYYRQVLDENGYPMIPDHTSVLEAIVAYIDYKLAKREVYTNKQGAYSKKREAENDWHWYCNQAKNKLFMPKNLDDWQNLLDQTHRLIHDKHAYYSFFGKINLPEYRAFNDPDYRNTHHNYFRGQKSHI